MTSIGVMTGVATLPPNKIHDLMLPLSRYTSVGNYDLHLRIELDF